MNSASILKSKDPAFAQELIDHHYYPDGYAYSDDEDTPVPSNLEEIREKLGKRRPSLLAPQFTDEEFRRFQRSNGSATTEAAVMSSIFPTILGRETMPFGVNYPFDNLKQLANTISKPNPAYFNGSRPHRVHTKVRRKLGEYIIPSNNNRMPLLPNFFLEVEGLDGDHPVMKNKFRQDIAYCARGMHKMQCYGEGQPAFDGKAYTIGSTYYAGEGTLQLYVMHPTKPADLNKEPGFHTTSIAKFFMTETVEKFREGAAAFRNAQAWAKERRDEVIALANKRAARNEEEEEEEGEEGEEGERGGSGGMDGRGGREGSGGMEGRGGREGSRGMEGRGGRGGRGGMEGRRRSTSQVSTSSDELQRDYVTTGPHPRTLPI
jgi:hypothetical protein